MGAIRRTINLIIALVLFAMGCGGLAYFYFIAATRNAGTFATSSVLLLVTAYMFGAGLLWAITQTIAWCIIFFFASAAASSAYLTASEIFPLETRALANACFYAFGTAIGGSTSPLLFGWLIESGSAWRVSFGYAIAALLRSSRRGLNLDLASMPKENRWRASPIRYPVEAVQVNDGIGDL